MASPPKGTCPGCWDSISAVLADTSLRIAPVVVKSIIDDGNHFHLKGMKLTTVKQSTTMRT